MRAILIMVGLLSIVLCGLSSKMSFKHHLVKNAFIIIEVMVFNGHLLQNSVQFKKWIRGQKRFQNAVSFLKSCSKVLIP